MSEARRSEDSSLLLRVSVPAGGAFHAIVKELAAKVAAYAGDPDDGKAVAAAFEEVAARVSPGGNGHDADIVFEFRRTDDEFLIDAHCGGRAANSRRPLPS